ncbi:MAG: lipid-A-disaccharide synthase [Rickettsiales bacterium]|jgi:lipid-A-disaccharide synthase|nr:lipid-A-disaccharide synthase [Rickettsiales bacterium]
MQKKKIKIFIIAGEVSGDILGAKIMREMPDAEFSGIGGENMRAAGLRPIFPISELAVMGLFEVLAHARALTRRIRQAAGAIVREKPDIVLTIDSPGFAKRVVGKVRSFKNRPGLKPLFYHLVAPQVWAWGAWRAKKFAKIFDRLYVFFDFEKPYFTKYGLPAVAVGHPIADGLPVRKERKSKEKIISLIPGSRMSEVKKLMPLFKQVARLLCNLKSGGREYRFYIPVVETTKDHIMREIKTWPVCAEVVPASERYELYARTYLAVAASGTVSAELAIMRVPAVIVYKMNFLTMLLARFLVKVKFVSLVNILSGKAIYPELLGRDATSGNIIRQVKRLSSAPARKKMIENLASVGKIWQKSNSAARLIAKDIAAQAG